jgi:transcriptional regulator with XRE-family HTH domain
MAKGETQFEEARKKRNMTQEELVLKCCTNKSYISVYSDVLLIY